jgi:hypothetical protein
MRNVDLEQPGASLRRAMAASAESLRGAVTSDARPAIAHFTALHHDLSRDPRTAAGQMLTTSGPRRYTCPLPLVSGPAMQVQDHAEIAHLLAELRMEHRDLDAAIDQLATTLGRDELQLTRLKKRKLLLKDHISRLESKLIPDLDA